MAPNTPVVIAIDAGTTGIRSVAFDTDALPVGWSYQEFTQHFPEPGRVEHDAAEIWSAVQATLHQLLTTYLQGRRVAAIGITNQRETVVAWDRSTGEPLHRAIVWQDRRGAADCARLDAEGHLPFVRAHTGLVLDPYFSGTKITWLRRNAADDLARARSLAFGTVDDWIIWNLTGGAHGGVHATDASNASRTLLYDIVERRWSPELCELFDAPLDALGEVRPSCGEFGAVSAGICDGLLTGVRVSGVLGDQQAALFGQACLEPGTAKNTYGTGSFVLLNVGAECPAPQTGLLTTVAWDLGRHAGPSVPSFAYALEGSVFITGAAIQWLRDGLQIIGSAAEIGPLAAGVDSTDGVFFVPAFTGLGSPWWDPYARGTIVGITRGTTRAHIARAVVESIALQTRDVVDAMTAASGTPLHELRVDGGAAVMDLLLQMQADQLAVAVCRPRVTESTALGAAFAAGLGEGVWGSPAEVASTWQIERRFEPSPDRSAANALHSTWRRAVERSRGWAI